MWVYMYLVASVAGSYLMLKELYAFDFGEVLFLCSYCVP